MAKILPSPPPPPLVDKIKVVSEKNDFTYFGFQQDSHWTAKYLVTNIYCSVVIVNMKSTLLNMTDSHKEWVYPSKDMYTNHIHILQAP